MPTDPNETRAFLVAARDRCEHLGDYLVATIDLLQVCRGKVSLHIDFDGLDAATDVIKGSVAVLRDAEDNLS